MYLWSVCLCIQMYVAIAKATRARPGQLQKDIMVHIFACDLRLCIWGQFCIPQAPCPLYW